MSSVSVIIPTKNRIDLLEITLTNVLNQTLKPYEVIVIDDHSTDKTEKIINEKFKEKVIYLKNDGKGPGSARNLGLKIATGKFIKYFDSDDLMTKNTLEVQVNSIFGSENSFVYSSYFQAKNIAGSWVPLDNIILHYFPFPNSQPLNHWMCRGLFIPIPSMLFSKDLLVELGEWRTDVTAYEDWDYLWRLGLLVPYPIHNNRCAFVYRTHGKQITENDFTNDQRDIDKIKVFQNIINNNFPHSLKYIDRLHLYIKIASLPNHVINNKLKKINLLLFEKLIQFNDKIGRFKTRTSWQSFSGPYLKKSKIDEYLHLIA